MRHSLQLSSTAQFSWWENYCGSTLPFCIRDRAPSRDRARNWQWFFPSLPSGFKFPNLTLLDAAITCLGYAISHSSCWRAVRYYTNISITTLTVKDRVHIQNSISNWISRYYVLVSPSPTAKCPCFCWIVIHPHTKIHMSLKLFTVFSPPDPKTRRLLPYQESNWKKKIKLHNTKIVLQVVRCYSDFRDLVFLSIFAVLACSNVSIVMCIRGTFNRPVPGWM